MVTNRGVEYPPNMGQRSGLGFEDRMCWMTVGVVGWVRFQTSL
jgi:hypothetical protein